MDYNIDDTIDDEFEDIFDNDEENDQNEYYGRSWEIERQKNLLYNEEFTRAIKGPTGWGI